MTGDEWLGASLVSSSRNKRINVIHENQVCCVINKIRQLISSFRGIVLEKRTFLEKFITNQSCGGRSRLVALGKIALSNVYNILFSYSLIDLLTTELLKKKKGTKGPICQTYYLPHTSIEEYICMCLFKIPQNVANFCQTKIYIPCISSL